MPPEIVVGSQGIKRGQTGWYKSNLPGTWKLYECDDAPGKYETRGPHLAPLGLDADTPLVFTVRGRSTK